jgi:voltage-gated sodium channel
VGVFLVLLTLNLVLALGANLLFGKILPEHFGDPLISSYTLFKVFTIEGWYEIPDHLARSGGDQSDVLFLRLYMIVSVLIGGILGLSLANAVFVDEMVNDNNEELENRVSELASEIRLLREELKAQAVGEASVENEGMPSD